MLYICNGNNKCKLKGCAHAEPHKYCDSCSTSGCLSYFNSYCIPYVETEEIQETEFIEVDEMKV